jgi:hypothetical protein
MERLIQDVATIGGQFPSGKKTVEDTKLTGDENIACWGY